MSLTVVILIAWAAITLVVITALKAAANADRRTALQLDELGLSLEGRKSPAGPGTLRSALAIEHGEIAINGYGALLLHRLAVQTCRLVGVEAAAIFLHDPARDELTLVAAHRLDPEQMGRRAQASGAVRDAVLMGSRKYVPATELWSVQHLLPPRTDALVAGIEGDGMRGALVAAGHGPYSERDLELIGHVADLGGAGLVDVQLRAGLDAALEGGVRALEAAIEGADLTSAGTSREVVRLATTLGRQLGLDVPALVELQLAARLREVGELAEGFDHDGEGHHHPLAPAEVSARAADVLARVPGLEVVALIVRHEHERWDGRGLPEALAAERIPLASRILAVATNFCQLTGPGRATDVDALAVISVASGTRFDPVVVETLAALALPAGASTTPAVEHPEWAAADLELALA